MGGRGSSGGGSKDGVSPAAKRAVAKLNAVYKMASANPSAANQAKFQKAHDAFATKHGNPVLMAGSDTFKASKPLNIPKR